MSPKKVLRRVPLALALVIFASLGLAILAHHVVAEPTRPSSTQGIRWVVQDNTIFGDRIDMVSADDGWILKLNRSKEAHLYRWNGDRWSFFSTLPHTQIIRSGDISMVSPSDGWVVLGGPLSSLLGGPPGESIIYHWDGNKWSYFDTISIPPEDISLATVKMISTSDGWATGSFLWGNFYYHWNGTSWENVKKIFKDYDKRDLDMFSPSIGWAVGDGISHWNGSDWLIIPSPVDRILRSVSMVSENDGWIVGGGYNQACVILHWDGVEWAEQVCPIESGLMAVDMVSVDDGWAVGEYGTILHWDGISWSKIPYPTPPTDQPILAIDMVSSTRGWFTGLAGGTYSYEVVPELTSNSADGSPGSFFTLTGSDYPANKVATVNVNGQDLGTVITDEAGRFSLILSTANADEGIYITTVSVNPAATTQFILDAGAPLRPQEGEATEISVPAGIALTEQLFLPNISR